MPDQKTEDILAHLRGHNRYIHSNAVANIPREPAQPLTAALSSLESQVIAHGIAHRIENAHDWPLNLKHVLYIIRAKGGTKTERTTITTLECRNEPIAIRDALNIKLTQLHIIGDAADWSFGYTTGKNKSSWSIVSFNCQDDGIKWKELNYFTLREQILSLNGSKSKSEVNKKNYKIKNTMMDDGDTKLREIFDKQTYDELSKNTRLFLGAKYKAGVERLSESEIEQYVMNGLAKDDKSKAVNNSSISSAANTGGWESKLDMMMNLFMVQMMNNMSQTFGHQQNQNNSNLPPSIPLLPGLAAEPAVVANSSYGPTRGNSSNTSSSRFTPLNNGNTDSKLSLPKL